eukprot:CAMPEP_0182444596 /NCGR_PEP_ID=MMETSP1172-20130603/3000_1 /TAXON_ID=708627 /ORGANISM="Timspurckia oligopyrenoides, Strain CCMP3278" /LENGTH=401 /DNA_ID=CAMNT_0024640193 /DNA_START=632 /DNA_END=1837 /DNA_ORIENTATION=+
MKADITLLPWNPHFELYGRTQFTYASQDKEQIQNGVSIVSYYETWEKRPLQIFADILNPFYNKSAQFTRNSKNPSRILSNQTPFKVSKNLPKPQQFQWTAGSKPIIVILPGFFNNSSDYNLLVKSRNSLEFLYDSPEYSMVHALETRGFDTIRVLSVERVDWLWNLILGALLDANFWSYSSTIETNVAFQWYLRRVRDTVTELYEEFGRNRKIVLVCHSAGGWLARGVIGDGENWMNSEGALNEIQARDVVEAVVTLGTPNLPPEDKTQDATRGLLQNIDDRYPGGFVKSIGYITVAGSAIEGSLTDGIVGKRAANSYQLVTGVSGVGELGDGVVPVTSAHLKCNSVHQITLPFAVHSIFEPGIPKMILSDRWYGHNKIIDHWLPVLESTIKRVREQQDKH